MQTEAAGERGGNGGLRRGKSRRRRGGVCPGDARLERTRGTGYSPGRGLFHASAPADSCRQEFRSSFCHRAYARSSVTKTRRSAAAAGHGRAAAGRAARRTRSCRPTDFGLGSRTYPHSHFHTVITPRWDGLIALLHICFHPRTPARTIHLFSTVTWCTILICWRSSKQRDPFFGGGGFCSGVIRR